SSVRRRKPSSTAPWPAGRCPARRAFSRMCTRKCRNTCGASARNWGSDMNDHNTTIQLETAMATTTMTMIQALRSAMDIMLERDDNVVVYGQDVGYFGGVFRCTEGLQNKYGKSRVFDAPISESGI